MWVKAGSNAGVIFKEGGGFGGFTLALRDGRLIYSTVAGNHASASLEADWPKDNAWHLVTATFSHGVHQLYIDDQLVAQGTMSGYIIPRHSAEGGLGLGGFRGSISDVRMYNRAINSPEVHQLFTHSTHD